MTDFDSVVIGAGAVGLACGAALATLGQSVLVIEAEAMAGCGISSRNSEVIHAGLYYPHGSLKHRLCIRGRHLLYDFLDRAGVRHRKCGKLVVASSDAEWPGIAALAERAARNEVENIALLEADAVRRMEPELHTVGALWSPETGIFDSHGYLQALEARIADGGGIVAFRTPVLGVRTRSEGGYLLRLGGDDPTEITTTRLVNSAGLAAAQIAARIEGLDCAYVPRMRLAKGSYFSLTGRSPFSRLIYPAPVDGGLGVHATLDLAGQVRFGPDVEWFTPEHDHASAADFEVDLHRSQGFYAAVRRYWPGLPDGALAADYAGIRPKLSGPGEPAADFMIQGNQVHGLPGLVNLFGIESPGLTSSLAIAEIVAAELT